MLARCLFHSVQLFSFYRDLLRDRWQAVQLSDMPRCCRCVQLVFRIYGHVLQVVECKFADVFRFVIHSMLYNKSATNRLKWSLSRIFLHFIISSAVSVFPFSILSRLSINIHLGGLGYKYMISLSDGRASKTECIKRCAFFSNSLILFCLPCTFLGGIAHAAQAIPPLLYVSYNMFVVLIVLLCPISVIE